MPVVKPGSDWDINGCIASAGYTWCEILGKCIRTWMEVCDIPNNCLTWNDGCNVCSVVEGETSNALGVCTEMYCFAQGEPFCQVFAPDVSIAQKLPEPYPIAIDPMPVTTMPVDPMPPVINPFLGDGH